MKKLLAKVFTKEWLVAAGVRALKTVAQAALAAIGTSMMLEDVNWKFVLSTSAVAGILSLLTSIAGLPELEKDTVPEVVIPEETNFVEVEFTEKEDNNNE
jgi:hypothetical protein